jgi:multiple antibiotic resistance protein
MRAVALGAFAMFFVTIAPLKNVPVFAALTRNRGVGECRGIAVRAVLFATVVLTVFAVFGDDLLRILGITLPAVRIGGGLLLMLMAIQMVFATPGGILDEQQAPASQHADVAVFPIAMPLIAGPGTITAVVMLMSQHTELTAQLVIYAMLLAVLLTTLAFFLAAGAIARTIGDAAMSLISRVMGILLMALAAEFVVQGVREALLT